MICCFRRRRRGGVVMVVLGVLMVDAAAAVSWGARGKADQEAWAMGPDPLGPS